MRGAKQPPLHSRELGPCCGLDAHESTISFHTPNSPEREVSVTPFPDEDAASQRGAADTHAQLLTLHPRGLSSAPAGRTHGRADRESLEGVRPGGD